MRNKIKYALAALALVVLAAVSPMKAQAAGGLELYTDYPGISVEAGDSQSISMYVSNDSGSAVEASLNILSMPEGWEGYFSGNGSQISRVHVQNGAEASLTFQLQIPEDAAEGSYTVQLQAVTDTGLTDTIDLVFDIQAVQYSQGSLETEYAEQEDHRAPASVSTRLSSITARRISLTVWRLKRPMDGRYPFSPAARQRT